MNEWKNLPEMKQLIQGISERKDKHVVLRTWHSVMQAPAESPSKVTIAEQPSYNATDAPTNALQPGATSITRCTYMYTWL